MKTQLNDRVLWFDGTSQVDPELVPALLLAGVEPSRLVVTRTNSDVQQFNALEDVQIGDEKVKNDPLDMSWNLPAEYLAVNLDDVISIELDVRGLLSDRRYCERAWQEMDQIRLRGMEPLIKTLVYIVSKFELTGTVWGVGRGSSCASLVLFLIGVHKVDPIKYGIPMEEFFHD